jgi:hypothetical protein
VCARLTCKKLYAIKSPSHKCIPLGTYESFPPGRTDEEEAEFQLHRLLQEWMFAGGWVWRGRYVFEFVTLERAAAEKKKGEAPLNEIEKQTFEHSRLNNEHEAVVAELRVLQLADMNHLHQEILVERGLSFCHQVVVLTRENEDLNREFEKPKDASNVR